MDRRRFLVAAGSALAGGLMARALGAGEGASSERPAASSERPAPAAPALTLFLCGDVMTGRGIDQILPHPSDPELYEPSIRSALDYLRLAEQETGPIPRPVDFSYVWGDALAELARAAPEARIVNLETAVTRARAPWPGKSVHYRMHPGNVPCLVAAGLDCCVLANNHVLDWGRPGLAETLDALHGAGIRTAGAGRDDAEATAPAVLEAPGKGRVLVLGFGMRSSGVPASWSAARGRSGVNVLADLSPKSVDAIAERVRAVKRANDVVVASIHWGDNWGFAIPLAQRRFAERLVDAAGVDVVHGHSSHHVKAIQVHRGKLILHGCGDLLTDYEGIGGYEEYRGELGLLYFPALEATTGRLLRLELVPTRMRRLRIERAPDEDARWLVDVLGREGRSFGTAVEAQPDGRLALRWEASHATPP